ncbi:MULTISPECIES: hypothetical protein [unclassified Chelatococcus]|uniref:hypothetical protein n=1 Tax=unclassified Chelatococcus TaxID=2638111 RepID=UPI0020BDF646|nr:MULTISPECIES: hypothetical protein [unclassified Chelatococcus]
MSGNTFDEFIYDLGQYHSSNRYDVVNRTNHLGRFQMSEASLTDIGMVHNDGKPFNNDFSGGWTGKYGVHSKEDFLASPDAQDRAIHDFLDKQVHFLRGFIHYDGQTINGEAISISGLLAAAHLAGAGGVRRFLVSGGEYNPQDAHGASLRDSLSCFHGYDVPYKVDRSRDYTFVGSESSDFVRGYAGKDHFIAKGGDDTFDGEAGEDTIELPGNRSEFTITPGPTSSMWQIRRELDEGCEEYKVIHNVELIRFADGEIVDLRHLPSVAPSNEPVVVFEPYPANRPVSDMAGPAPQDARPVDDVSVTPVGLPANDPSDALPNI